MTSGLSGHGSARRVPAPAAPRRAPGPTWSELTDRFASIEWVLLAILVVVPTAFIWHFASSSYFFWDDLALFYQARNSGAVWSYAFDPAWGYLAPAYSLAYLALDRIAPMNFEVALGTLVACQAVSAVLLQRILTLLFGRVWWTYALALAWAISAIYLPSLMWFAAGAHSITGITATLASIHGYLCWRATGRPAWLVWSLVAIAIGIGFYVKALLIPLYLVLMRVLLLDPGSRLRDSLRSVLGEWRVWLAYGSVCAGFLLVYSLGDYSRPASGATPGDLLSYLRVFWFEGFSPLLFGIHVPQFGQTDWHRIAIAAAQVAVIGLIVWSIVRRRAAWRAWAFLIVALAANALMLIGRLSEWGAETIAFIVRYYTESALLVPLAIAFAFAVPRFQARVAAVAPQVPTAASASWTRRRRPATEMASFRLPTARTGAVALIALAAYVGATWASADTLSRGAEANWWFSGGPDRPTPARYTRTYIDNLRADLAATRRASVEPSLVDHDVPEPVVPLLANLDPEGLREGVRYTLLSSIVPLFDEEVTFNQPGRLFIVQPDGHLERTRFVRAAGGSITQLQESGRLRLHEARVERRRGEWCVVAEGLSAVEWVPHRPLRGRDWWLRASYQTDPVRHFEVQTDPGFGWVSEGSKLPPRASPGPALVPLAEYPSGVPTNDGVRLGVPPFGRLCLRSIEIGSFDPAPTPPAG
jgi:hypothetical protein